MHCASSIQAVALRATRLGSNGAPTGGATGSYVSQSLVRVGMNPEIAEGEEIEQFNGSGCLCVSYKNPDVLKRMNMELEDCKLEPALLEMMVGAELIPGAEEGSAVGNIFPVGGALCAASPPGVAFEWWTLARDGAGPLAEFQYIRWVIPKTVWTLGDNEFSAEAMVVNMTGYSENNPNFADPYGDLPAEYDNPEGRPFWIFTNDLPEAACDYAELALSGSGS